MGCDSSGLPGETQGLQENPAQKLPGSGDLHTAHEHPWLQEDGEKKKSLEKVLG